MRGVQNGGHFIIAAAEGDLGARLGSLGKAGTGEPGGREQTRGADAPRPVRGTGTCPGFASRECGPTALAGWGNTGKTCSSELLYIYCSVADI